ncbi:MAG: hypothetical protein IKI04_00470 [Bacilli bacterium]|nr:hypothetical protein [Bacilli bacterium]
MDNEVKVTNLKSIIITIALVVLIITAGTFAWLNYRSKSTAMVLTIGDINDIQITLKPYQLDLELSPVLTYTSLDANEEYVTVSVVNNSSSQQYFSLFYDISHIDSSLNSTDFKYTVLKSTDNWSTSNVDTSGNFLNANTTDDFVILDEISIPANTTWYYRVYTWLDGSNNPNVSNAVFKADLNAELYGSTKPLPKFIRNNAIIDNISSTYVTNANGVQFNDVSSDTNGKGLYLRAGTENTAHPIYYYRGTVTNNNVLFAGFCWKIVRTTNTGGIKLIYNGVPSNGECNNTDTNSQLASTSAFSSSYDSPADGGYMYGMKYVIARKAPSDLATPYLYGNSFTYSNGTYTLVDTITSTGTWSSDYTTLNNNHYTCFNTTGTCSSIYYIQYTHLSNGAYYITLSDGKSVSDAISEMLTNSSNTSSSVIKTAIDNW